MLLTQVFILVILLFSTSTFSQTDSELIKRQILEARQVTQYWQKLQKQGTVETDVYANQAERSSLIIKGIPSFVREINPKGILFRHYVGSNMPIILQSRQLKTGITPYIVVNPGYSREVFVDLVGIFLTTPQTPPEKVGLPANPNADYIDFTLYPGTPVVQIEPEILLIPGRKDIPEWMKALYVEYKKTGKASSEYLETFKALDQVGGPRPSFMRINILRYRFNGKTFSVR